MGSPSPYSSDTIINPEPKPAQTATAAVDDTTSVASLITKTTEPVAKVDEPVSTFSTPPAP